MESIYNWWKNLFWSTSKNYKRTYDNIQIITRGQENDYATVCLLDYPYFKKYCKMIVINIIKQKALVADLKAIEQVNFTGNLNPCKYCIFLLRNNINVR